MPISRIKTDGINDDAITSAKIGVDVIVADDLAANSVTVSELTNNAVTTAKIANGAITDVKLATDSVGTDAIGTGVVGTTQIAADAVTGDKLANNITIAGTLGVTGATSLSNNLSLVKNQAAHTNIDVFNNSGSGSAKGQIRVGYDAANCLEIFRVGNDANIILNATQNGSIIFQGAGGEMMRMSTAGLAIGGTGAANTFDDYEEGTYTPTLASSGCTFSYSVQLGSYVKIGNFVYLQFNITLSNRTGTTTNSVFLDNIPFLTKNVDNSLYSGGHIGHYFNINLGSGSTIAYQIPAVSTNVIQLMEVGDNSGENGIVASELNTNAVIRGSVMYRAVT